MKVTTATEPPIDNAKSSVPAIAFSAPTPAPSVKLLVEEVVDVSSVELK